MKRSVKTHEFNNKIWAFSYTREIASLRANILKFSTFNWGFYPPLLTTKKRAQVYSIIIKGGTLASLNVYLRLGISTILA